MDRVQLTRLILIRKISSALFEDFESTLLLALPLNPPKAVLINFILIFDGLNIKTNQKGALSKEIKQISLMRCEKKEYLLESNLKIAAGCLINAASPGTTRQCCLDCLHEFGE